jgi:(2Fe-2S) ferredoxin
MSTAVERGFEKAEVSAARKHLFVCIGPDCCNLAQGEALWEVIKRRVKETGVPVMRTKAACLRICAGGPWLVVYPEGTWYGAVTPERFERILQQHIIGDAPVDEWIIRVNNLREESP